MTTQEFKKKIYDAVEPLLDGQGQVRFKAHEYLNSNALSINWWDSNDDLIASADISETPELLIAGYSIGCDPTYDYGGRLNAHIRVHATISRFDRGFFEDFDGVEKVLRTFTEYLVREFN